MWFKQKILTERLQYEKNYKDKHNKTLNQKLEV